ncbi:MAG: 1-deoxy-D-xylulose-5-phosphate reductoisomerase [Dehalococcoidia bacterium]
MTGVAVLGSTGSIGAQTLDVIRSLPEHFHVVALAAGRNVDLLYRQVTEFRPRLVCADAEIDRALLADVQVAPIVEVATHPDVDVVVVGTVGAAGLLPTLAALRAGKAVALANKEALVMAGELVVATAKAGGGQLRPVDSEHSAIWQCLWGEEPDGIARLLLTASGGALRDLPLAALADVTPAQALRHPTWSMGRKITVDSATLFNKGLETMEAHWLFDVPMDRIEVVMHRESIVHSLVEFLDGSIKAQLGTPSMMLPIQCALSYPRRLPRPHDQRLDLGALGSLRFASPDFDRYPCLSLAIEAGRKGQSYPAVAAAADEVAVERFLATEIRFTDIAAVIEQTLAAHDSVPAADLDTILAADAWARSYARRVGGVAAI